MSAAEETFAAAWAALSVQGLPAPEREYRFHPTRKWRFDFAWPALKVAVEIEGRGRHQTFTGYAADCHKYNEAVALGWRVLRFPAAYTQPGRTRDLWRVGAADMALDALALVCAAR